MNHISVAATGPLHSDYEKLTAFWHQSDVDATQEENRKAESGKSGGEAIDSGAECGTGKSADINSLPWSGISNEKVKIRK